MQTEGVKIENLIDFLRDNLEFFIPSRELGEKIAKELDAEQEKANYEDFSESNLEEFQKQNPGVTLTVEDFRFPEYLKSSPDAVRQYITEQICYKFAHICVKENLTNQNIQALDFLRTFTPKLMGFNLSEDAMNALSSEFVEWAKNQKELVFDWGIFRYIEDGEFELIRTQKAE